MAFLKLLRQSPLSARIGLAIIFTVTIYWVLTIWAGIYLPVYCTALATP